MKVNYEIIGKAKESRLLESDIFFQTSRSKNFRWNTRSIGYGIPCLVTKGTGNGDFIQSYNAGRVAETESKSVADALARAIDEPEYWPEKFENAIRLIRGKFLWDAVAAKTIYSYDNLLVDCEIF